MATAVKLKGLDGAATLTHVMDVNKHSSLTLAKLKAVKVKSDVLSKLHL